MALPPPPLPVDNVVAVVEFLLHLHEVHVIHDHLHDSNKFSPHIVT